jgi:two-component system chemotaxis response regulator CheY
MKVKIFVADDSEEHRKHIVEVLKRLDHEVVVTEAIDGTDGSAKIKAGQYDFFILDFHMPGATGYELAQQVRQDPNHRDKPIILYTTERNRDLMQEARSLGKLTWMLKPMNEEKFTKVISERISADPSLAV